MAFTLSSLQAGSYQGNKGDKGDPGDKGDKGVDGVIGLDGAKGEKGDAGQAAFDLTLDAFTGDGGNTQFILTTQPLDETHTIVQIDGVVQLKSSYSLSGNTIIFSEAPGANSEIEITTLTGGSKGQKGDEGAASTVAGPAGDKGDKGDAGTAGDKGDVGIKGDKGDSGGIDLSSITNTAILFADGSSANGSAAFTFDKTSNTITVGGSIVPSANVSYDLGTSNMRFKDLYLSGNTIDLGGATISSNGTSLTLPEIVIQPAGQDPIVLSVSNGSLTTSTNGQVTSLSTPRYVSVIQTGSITSPLTSNTRYYPPVDMTLTKVYAHVGTAPGSNFSFQLKKNGTSFGTFTIASGEYVLTPNSINVSLTTADYLTMAVTAGTSSELHVDIEYTTV